MSQKITPSDLVVVYMGGAIKAALKINNTRREFIEGENVYPEDFRSQILADLKEERRVLDYIQFHLNIAKETYAK